MMRNAANQLVFAGTYEKRGEGARDPPRKKFGNASVALQARTRYRNTIYHVVRLRKIYLGRLSEDKSSLPHFRGAPIVDVPRSGAGVHFRSFRPSRMRGRSLER